MKPPRHLLKSGRDAYKRYAEQLPDFPELVESLAEIDQLIREAFKRARGTTEKPASYADHRFYLSLIDKRVDLLSVAGLTPKSRKQLTGTSPTANEPDDETRKDDEFLDS